MNSAISALTGGTLLAFVGVASARAQQIPVVSLPTATARTTDAFGAILGVRQVANGRVLVDDGGWRQVKLLDSTLATSTVVMDSAAGTSRSYGRRPAPLIPYPGDSTLFPDYVSRAMLVIDGNGKVVRSLALPSAQDVGLIRRGSGVDAAGRLLFLGNAMAKPAAEGEAAAMADSVPILRANFDLRRTDTIGRIARPLTKSSASSPDGSLTINVWTVDPLQTLDEWAVLFDGSVAFVRGHDYHVDLIRPNGASISSGKLPFDWRRLTDDDKRRIMDSTRAQLATSIENGSIVNQADMITVVRSAGPAGPPPSANRGRGGAPGAAPGGGFAGFKLQPADPPSLDKIADYYPPVRTGAALGDLDGNLWILPSTSKQSQQGELVYDVVNPKGELFERVRIPLGRLVVGFGQGGVVYMVSGDRTNGFHLERSRIPGVVSGPAK